jgi:predicted MPP superfamily phosphohydrolase
MKQLVIAVAACVVLAGAIAFSRNPSVGGFVVVQESRNPWTHSKLNTAPEQFQFAIVSDRTGGHRAKIFSQAVQRLNLLQPEFVVSVGDLIEGGRKPRDKIEAEWKEFDSYVNQLTMPFFYVPGNHDVGNDGIDAIWQERYGRRWYHFVYKNVLFLILNTDDRSGGAGVPSLGNEQLAYAKKVLADNKDVRWTIVLLHKPIWTAPNLEKRGWTDIEKALANRPYTVFCGHVHRYQKFVRQGRNYYQLATTGGGSRLRGIEYGEFDHIAWVTMKNDGPVIANVMLNSIYPDDLKEPESNEEGLLIKKLPTHPVRITVYHDGVPLAGAFVSLSPQGLLGKLVRGGQADGITAGDGSFVPSSYGAFDGVPAGKYLVTARKAGQTIPKDPKANPVILEIPEGGGDFTVNLPR